MRRLPLVALAIAVAAATPAAASGLGGLGIDSGSTLGAHAWKAPPDDHWAGHGFDPTNPAGCDPIDPAQCMLPYPNDWFTKDDPTSKTGRRLDLNPLAMPRNVAGKPINPVEWNRSDGFSAGAQILTYVPGMTDNADIEKSGIPPVTDLGLNNDKKLDPGVVLLDTRTGQRVPVWGEIDQYLDESGPAQTGTVQQDLMIHPAVDLDDATRYIVALRHLVLDDGSTAKPSAAFAAYRDGTAPATDPRRAHMESIFSTLKQAGIARQSLYLAWDFTTASTQNVTGRLLAMRDDAFKQLGDTNLDDGKVQGHAPTFTVDSVQDFTPAQDSQVARRISGHFTVPCYLFPTCDPPTKCDQITQGTVNDCPTPGQFLLDPSDPDAVPQQTPGVTYQANYICNVGRQAFESHTPMRPVEYGHGLFGSADEVNSSPQKTMANNWSMLYCATDWTGMATADVPNAVLALTDLSRFPFLTDRVQQGELNFLYLARLMVHPQGFSSNPAFQWSDGADKGKSFIDTSAAYYDGNSQGGIYGGTVCAVSVDVRKCVLGVPGMDYSILLPRSSDYVAEKHLSSYDPTQFDPGDPTGQIGYSQLLDTAYPDQSQRMLILDLIQTLWDRSDPNGYAAHMTDGLPDTPHHDVLLQVAYGDHQVANITAETEARTIGAHAFVPALVPARYAPYQDPLWDLPPIRNGSYGGSAIALFDSGPATYERPVDAADGGGTHAGTTPPPAADIPNREGEDPHEAPRRAACGQEMKSLFLAVDGSAVATCGGAPYFSWGWDGKTGL
ncbi:MAG TPA: hypothetical protein VFT62_04595 [Mycobacteriales bacterium]|nr:hypothetical protein [Mycobacteriales bacterium]